MKYLGNQGDDYGIQQIGCSSAEHTLSIDEKELARLERLFFDAYNETDVLIGDIERYIEWTVYNMECAFVYKIYRKKG